MSKFDRRGSDSFIDELSTTPLPECGRVHSADGQVLGGARQKFTLPEESQYGQHKGLDMFLYNKFYIMISSESIGESRGRFTVFIMGQCLVLII